MYFCCEVITVNWSAIFGFRVSTVCTYAHILTNKGIDYIGIYYFSCKYSGVYVTFVTTTKEDQRKKINVNVMT
jgi:hypothetical protein